MLTDEPYCKVVSSTTFIKIRGSNRVYEEAIEASAKFNKRIVKERRTRLPFLDSQTTVAQGNCMLWNREYQRTQPGDNSAVLQYKVKRWLKKRRLKSENGGFGMTHRASTHAPVDLIMHSNELEQLSTFITNSRHIAFSKKLQSTQSAKQQLNDEQNNYQNHNYSHNHEHHKINVNLINTHANNNSESHGDEEDSSKHDNENEAEDEEEANRKKQVKKGGRSRKNALDVNGEEKNFVCDQCGAKYKTRPGLSYHVQKTHNMRLSVNPSGSGSPVTVAKNKITREPVDSNTDDNTNSIFESVYDDNSSSLPQGSQSSVPTPLNQNTNSNQAKSNGNAPLKCGVCFGIEQEPRGQTSATDKFIACSDCNKYFHPTSCLGFNAKMIESVKQYKWQCIECKRCTICGNSENDDKLLFCDDCDRGYHMYCLTPPLTEAPAGDWHCGFCLKASAMEIPK